MPVSMIHTQHTSNYPPYGLSLAPPDLPSYSFSPSPQPPKNPPLLYPSSNPGTGYISTSSSKDDTTYRFHLPSTTHNTENYPANNNKSQYDNNHVPAALKHNINSDLDMPSLNGNYHPPTHAFPLYNLGSVGNSAPVAANHVHHSHNNINFSHVQAHEGHTTNYPTMTSFTTPPSLPTHFQLATENVVSSHPSATGTQTTQSTNDINSMERRGWANHARGWTPQPPLSTPPSSPNKSPSPPSLGTQPTATPSPPLESPRNTSPTHPSHTTRSSTRSNQLTPQLPPTLPKLRTSLPSPSPPSSPASTTSSSPPSSPRSSNKRRRSDQERREKHNDTERVLKALLPELQNSAAPKVSVLQCAVDTIKRRTEYANTMQQQNAHLRDENKRLKADLARLQGELGMANLAQPLPLHLHPVPPNPTVHYQLETLDHTKRHDGYSFHGPLPSPSASLPLPAKQWF